MRRILAGMLCAAMAAVACGTSAEKKTDVVYDARFGEDTSMDVYLPEPPEGHSVPKRPTVLFIHGGSWRHGSKEAGMHLGERLAGSGYVVASINYRLLPEGQFPKNLQDCICALAFLNAHADEYRIDPNRIVVMGYSAGAHLASLVGIAHEHPELAADCEVARDRKFPRPAAVISGSGPQDMREFWENIKGIEEVLGGTPDSVPHVYDLASPTHHVKAGAQPYLIVTDLTTGGGNATMRDKLASVGADVRLLKIAGSLHIIEQGTDPGVLEPGVSTETPEAWIAIDDFLARTVGRP